MKKQKHSWAILRAREPGVRQDECTPTKRQTDVSGGARPLVINTGKKSPMHVAQLRTKILEKVSNLKTKYITSNEEMNCVYLCDVLGEDVYTLKNIKFPANILSEIYTKETTISLKKRRSIKRTPANLVQKRTAKYDFQTALSVIMACKEMADADKQVFSKFFKLYDINDLSNKNIPCAEWCHMTAMSLSTNAKDAMASDNLFAATAMVNTRMINFENSAKRLASDGHTVKIATEYATFKNTATLAQLLQILTVTDRYGNMRVFKQKINPFEVNDVHRSNSTQDPNHVYNYIADSLKSGSISTLAPRSKSLLFSACDESRKRIRADPEYRSTPRKCLRF